MRGDMSLLVKALQAYRAFKGFLSCVGSHVPDQVGVLQKGFATLFTFIFGVACLRGGGTTTKHLQAKQRSVYR